MCRRGLAVNRRTKELLIANRLVRDEECEAVYVLDKPYKGAEILDRKYGKAEPLLSPTQRDRLRAREQEGLAEFLAHPKPVRTVSLPRALGLLRARKRSAPKDFARPARLSAALKRSLPHAWQQVLRIANGGRIRDCEIASGFSCTIRAVDQLAEQQRQEVRYYRDIGAEIPDRWQLVMQTELGDSVWLDAKPRDTDARVVLISHETGTEERAWSSVAGFLEELLGSN